MHLLQPLFIYFAVVSCSLFASFHFASIVFLYLPLTHIYSNYNYNYNYR